MDYQFSTSVQLSREAFQDTQVDANFECFEDGGVNVARIS
jgi:hypothetical protein